MPTVTKSGWVGSNWLQVGDCCFRKTFTPSPEASWSCVATEPIQTFDWSVSCNTSFLTWNNHSQPLWFEQGDPNAPCPIPEELCCPDPTTPVTIGTTSSTYSYRGVVAFWLWYRPQKIEVYVTRALVDCGNGTEVCKYSIVSKYFYEYRYATILGEDHNWNRTASLSNNCFVKNSQYDTTSNGWVPLSRYGFNMLNPPDLSSMTWYNTCLNPPTVDISTLPSGNFSFDRVKLYDALPVGTETFDNSNVSFSCPIDFQEICQNSFNPVTQVCLFSPSGIFSEPPCWCDGTIVELSTNTETLANRCNYDTPDFGFPDQYVTYSCTQMGPNGPMICTINYGGCDLVASPCATYDKHCTGLVNGIPTIVTYTVTNQCNQYLGSTVGGASSVLFDCSCNAINNIPPQPAPENQAFWYDPSTCNSENCNSNCCFEFHVCEACEEQNLYKCYSKYTGIFRDITSRTVTWNCSGVTQRSYCINSPSWTLTFA